MSWQNVVQFAALAALLALTVPPLGRYIAAVFGAREDGSAPGDRVFGPIERRVYRILGVDDRREQRWNVYAASLMAFSLLSVLLLYAMLRTQSILPFNPTDREALDPTGAFNTAISFVTNTNWQWYSGEVSISHLTQMLGLAVQNFVSAAVGLAVVVALIRGITRSGLRNLGNFWVDLTRGLLRILLPLSLVAAVVLMSQGVVQNLNGNTTATTIDTSSEVVEQQIPGGPVASQEAIKELGTNGGGYYNANSSHPFENTNGFTNFLQIYMLLLIPLSLVVTFGTLVKDKRQSRLLLAVMAGILVLFAGLASLAEQNGNPKLTELQVDQSLSSAQSGGNMEGKEVRFGAASCGVFAAATTGTSTGAVNCMHDSFTPIGGLAPMLHMMLGEISPGGVGVGLSGMLVMALLSVFIAGLMVGRTPEYLGKKIQAAEMKLVTLYILAMPFALLTFAAAAVVLRSATTYQGAPHGLSEVLYNYASTANNNGSAFAYQGTGTQWYTVTQGISMLMGRFFTIIPVLAIGGALAAKPKVPATAGTMPTHNALFGFLVAGVIAIVAGLTFFPALALGPILEHLSL
ncbi:MAG: potassium-transporting ATPase subunit KdpA [Ilumatobacteraceae bacterium]|nr:potassium-transporting ATPase subunit KdpA [Ilumatobacteraceae bacterium]MBP7890878.1 potassium-transporting ATPase subunit KdpA [Ilumatobacteraceae bacterium]MBP8210715.1 potassium-transporting ATPase subunit KdpA [Ilumatobacteraceae bacterium]HRA86270.1 potassium-transporting ATPase subunit KdpA [Ilumatobacteraceae bacterium]